MNTEQNVSLVSPVMPVIDQHSKIEDALAMLIGTFILSFAMTLLQQAGIMTGGTAGLSLLLHYITDIKFGVLFFLINIPFYYFAYKKMGIALVVKTFIAVALLAGFTEIIPQFFHLSDVNPIYATIFANVLMGVSFLILFRHRSSLGGINLLALYLQERFNIAAGKVQLGIDLIILLASLFFVDWKLILISILGVIILNSIVLLNHKTTRYVA
ncbi:YitT family protein [Acinetobacter sp. NIPH 1958]|uniref:YitT family protein n=1 Tax=unclassified Acinetobacter TaxID=196816 RepID=UPI0003A4570D|nr:MULTISPECIES: YitT family protein [unclassified Acinetobacter]MCH7351135.1 YitT family protein [Acinetobacter sp. NIPH 2023]MCH7356455.1 YitT family protein [Acinetobacter sp. NIPH 1958]MCH7358988.1 YitT family protein [Acinetobacter sp. NIPH 2024]